jgi:hypothetical protein
MACRWVEQMVYTMVVSLDVLMVATLGCYLVDWLVFPVQAGKDIVMHCMKGATMEYKLTCER